MCFLRATSSGQLLVAAGGRGRRIRILDCTTAAPFTVRRFCVFRVLMVFPVEGVGWMLLHIFLFENVFKYVLSLKMFFKNVAGLLYLPIPASHTPIISGNPKSSNALTSSSATNTYTPNKIHPLLHNVVYPSPRNLANFKSTNSQSLLTLSIPPNS